MHSALGPGPAATVRSLLPAPVLLGLLGRGRGRGGGPRSWLPAQVPP